MGLRAVFIHSEQKSEDVLDLVIAGHFQVVFLCVEMLESPMCARIVHAKKFQLLLGGIYLDEAHLVFESVDWRGPYGRLHEFRRVVGSHIPLIAISATLPSLYRAALCQYAGLEHDYELILSCSVM